MLTFKDPLVFAPPLVELHLSSNKPSWMPASRKAELDELRQAAASKIVPGWTVVTAKDWRPKNECGPMVADLRAEAAHRDPAQRVAHWGWEKCIEFLTTFPRPPGVIGFPLLPPMPLQTSQTDDTAEGTRAQLLAERPRRPSENTAFAGSFASPTAQHPLPPDRSP